MAYSNVQYVGNGVTKTYYLPFEYLSQTHVQVYVNGVLKTAGSDYAWTTSNAITFTTAPASGIIVTLKRSSSPATKLVDFADGSVLTEEVLDLNTNQLFFLNQENLDSLGSALHPGIDGQWDAAGSRISNVGNPIAATDAVNKQTIDTVYPAVNIVSDNVSSVNIVASDLGSTFGHVTDLGLITESTAATPTVPSRIDTIITNLGDIHTVATAVPDITIVANNIDEITAATEYAVNASASATNAASSATSAATSATNAATSATNAATSATAASSSATTAAGSVTSANTAASLASDWAIKTTGTVSGSEYSAKYYAQQAAGSVSSVTALAAAASTSATNASSSASAASSSASSASTSATAASGSASAASTSASTASTAAANASASASAASTSATNAASSATSASGAATTATAQATIATTKASDAATSATAAASAQSAAETARDQTLAAYDSFDDRYLGTKSSDPTLDNDGNALVAGALYFNSTSGGMKVYTGTAWVAAYASLSGALLVSNNLSDIGSAATARTNLGLGSAAVTNTGTASGNTVTRDASNSVPISSAWSVKDVSGTLYFAYNGTNKCKLDSSGNFTVVGNVTAYGTV